MLLIRLSFAALADVLALLAEGLDALLVRRDP